jgi:TRAP-type C4-dicarboxylate transport system substrate-binding protein
LSSKRVTRTAAVAVAAIAVAVGVTACSGSGVDKAGGGRTATALVLTLASRDDSDAATAFTAAVAHVSHGSIRIEVRDGWRRTQANHARGLVDDVRQAKVQLAIVGAGAWDSMGVNSFRALLAPFLVESLELERRALESPVAMQMLDAVGEAGVVGVALIPGALRSPVGLSHRLVRPRDYAGRQIGVESGRLAGDTVSALGAIPETWLPDDFPALDGAELDPATITRLAYDQFRPSLTTNVVFWPRVLTVVMNRAAYAKLDRAQRELLRRSSRRVLQTELARIERDRNEALVSLCQRGELSLVTATAADLAALRRTVQPVYDELARDPQTKQLIAQINAMRGSASVGAPAVRCPSGSPLTNGRAPALEGRWKLSLSGAELRGAGLLPAHPETLTDDAIFLFGYGRFVATAARSGAIIVTGEYSVSGDVVTMVFQSGDWGVEIERPYELKWSVYRDQLTFSAVPGREPIKALIIRPLARVR